MDFQHSKSQSAIEMEIGRRLEVVSDIFANGLAEKLRNGFSEQASLIMLEEVGASNSESTPEENYIVSETLRRCQSKAFRLIRQFADDLPRLFRKS